MRKDHVLMDGRDVNDAAPLFGGKELADKRLREEKRALQVHTEHCIIVCLAYVGEVRRFFNSCVVDEDVARPKFGPCSLD
jgi:hypothetical protein